jgi:peptide/nickel transport system permease protein
VTAAAGTAPGPAAEEAAPRVTAERLRLLLRSPSVLVGLAIILAWIVSALIGGRLVPYDPYADDLLNTLQPPDGAHWFGTDQLGRDIFSRVVIGARDILTVAPLATLLGTLLGTALGLVSGYFRGIVDDLVSRLVEAFLAVPLTIIALLALVALGTSNVTVIVVIGVAFAPNVARTVRAAVIGEAGLDYVTAARLRAEGPLRIMFVEILPNVMAPVLVETTVRLGYAVFTVATLSFIGFGIQPPSADWGLAISESYTLVLGGFWWPVVANAAAIVSLVVALNLVSEGVKGAFEQ